MGGDTHGQAPMGDAESATVALSRNKGIVEAPACRWLMRRALAN